MNNNFFASLTNELILVDQAKADPEAFAAIYDIYFARIYNYARYRVLDPLTADDLTSEIFEKVLVKLHTYQSERGPFSAWLFTISRNTVNYHLRKQKIRQWVSLENFRNQASREPKPDEQFTKDETQRELLGVISRLSEQERELIALKFNGGLTNRTISEITGLKENNVAVILHRVIKRIRAQLEVNEVLK